MITIRDESCKCGGMIAFEQSDYSLDAWCLSCDRYATAGAITTARKTDETDWRGESVIEVTNPTWAETSKAHLDLSIRVMMDTIQREYA